MKLLLITIAAVVLVGCGPSVSINKDARDGNIEAVKQHLAAGADVNAKDGDGWTPLHFPETNKEIVELLIAAGADVNAKDQDDVTPLHFVQTKETAELLIAKGADVNAKDIEGKTLLDWAIEDNQPEIADFLRKYGGKTGEELKAAGN